MDRFICHCEALGDVDIATIIRGVKRKYPSELESVILEVDAIEKRIACLELHENDYFKEGMLAAVARVEAAGFVLPPGNNDGDIVKDGRAGLVPFPLGKGVGERSNLLTLVIGYHSNFQCQRQRERES